MSFDGLFTRAMTEELAGTLTGGKITKIQQPYKNELILINCYYPPTPAMPGSS